MNESGIKFNRESIYVFFHKFSDKATPGTVFKLELIVDKQGERSYFWAHQNDTSGTFWGSAKENPQEAINKVNDYYGFGKVIEFKSFKDYTMWLASEYKLNNTEK